MGKKSTWKAKNTESTGLTNHSGYVLLGKTKIVPHPTEMNQDVVIHTVSSAG